MNDRTSDGIFFVSCVVIGSAVMGLSVFFSAVGWLWALHFARLIVPAWMQP